MGDRGMSSSREIEISYTSHIIDHKHKHPIPFFLAPTLLHLHPTVRLQSDRCITHLDLIGVDLGRHFEVELKEVLGVKLFNRLKDLRTTQRARIGRRAREGSKDGRVAIAA